MSGMSMQELLKKRSNERIKKAGKYAKYIFNDHFVIVIIFILGALALQYSEFVKTLEPDYIWGKVLWAIVLSAAVSFGRPATLVEPADLVFLSSQEREWVRHLADARKRSLLLPFAVLLFLSAVAMPMLYLGQAFSLVNLAGLAFIGLLLKWTELGISLQSFHMGPKKRQAPVRLLLFVAGIFVYLAALWTQVLWGLLLALLVLLVFEAGFRKANALLDWTWMVDSEEGRQARINRLINLFTDVPQVQSRAKRRKKLDGVVRQLAGKGDNPYQYLYARAFVRNGDYSGLYLRLLALGCLVLAFAGNLWLTLLLSVLFLYLTGFQLLPMYAHFDQHVLNRLYPVTPGMKYTGYLQALRGLLLLEAVAFALFALVGAGWQAGISVLVLNLLFLFFFFRIYMKSRLRMK